MKCSLCLAKVYLKSPNAKMVNSFGDCARQSRSTAMFLTLLCLVVYLGATGNLFSTPHSTVSANLPQPCLDLSAASRETSRLIQGAVSQPSAQTYHALGESFAEINEFTCSIAAYELAVKLDPRSWRTRQNLVLTLIQTGDLRRAASELRDVIRQQPDSHLAHNGLGLALESFGELTPAREEFEAAVRISPRFALGYYNLAYVASTENHFAAAVFYAAKAVSLDPREPAYQLALGIAYSQDQKFERSIGVLKKLAALHPDLSEAYHNLGTVYAKQKDFDAAVHNYRQVLKLDPGNLEALLSLSIALVAKVQAVEALRVLKDYINSRPRDLQGYYWRGRAYKDLTQCQDDAESV